MNEEFRKSNGETSGMELEIIFLATPDIGAVAFGIRQGQDIRSYGPPVVREEGRCVDVMLRRAFTAIVRLPLEQSFHRHTVSQQHPPVIAFGVL